LIIESAFFKLPELLTSSFSHRDTYEATVVHFLSLALNMELNSRNIPRPYEHIVTEKPYPIEGDSFRRLQADLFLKLEGAVPTDARMALYGARPLNWIEVKAYLGSTRKSNSPPKTENVGRILKDILRLCLFPKEWQGKHRQNGRYLILVFSNEPQKSLAFKSGGRPREWLQPVFSDGEHEVTIDLSLEQKSFRKVIGPGFMENPDLQVELKLRTSSFIPNSPTPGPVFWGYLMRISDFTVKSPDVSIHYEDRPNDNWSSERIEKLEKIQKYVVENMS